MLWRYRLGSGNGQTSQENLDVYDVQRNIWFWYRHDQDLFYACDQMSEEQFALPTFLPKTAIVGIRNIYDFPDALLELQDTFKRSLNISV